ncbi:MAG: AAA family ATPase, partial [Dehalococcoidia bacterium]
MGKPVVTVSRQHGSGGEQVAALVAERLGVPLLDQEIRQRAAERAGVGERTMLDAERPVGFVTRMLERMGSAGFMLDNGGAVAASQFPVPSLESYRETLGQVVREAAAGGAVIVGSAAHLTLRDYPGVVRVLVQAPIEARIVRLVEEEGLSPAEARRQAETEDRERVRFYQESYRVNWYDSRLYDCIVDTHRLGVD